MRIFRPNRDEAIGGCRKLHNEELHIMYFSLYIIRVIKSRRMRWARHETSKGIKGMHVEFLWEARRKEGSRKTDVNERIILKWSLEKEDGVF
jgi:hypothetical protein